MKKYVQVCSFFVSATFNVNKIVRAMKTLITPQITSHAPSFMIIKTSSSSLNRLKLILEKLTMRVIHVVTVIRGRMCRLYKLEVTSYIDFSRRY